LEQENVVEAAGVGLLTAFHLLNKTIQVSKEYWNAYGRFHF
jgi:hypothetical protein